MVVSGGERERGEEREAERCGGESHCGQECEAESPSACGERQDGLDQEVGGERGSDGDERCVDGNIALRCQACRSHGTCVGVGESSGDRCEYCPTCSEDFCAPATDEESEREYGGQYQRGSERERPEFVGRVLDRRPPALWRCCRQDC